MQDYDLIGKVTASVEDECVDDQELVRAAARLSKSCFEAVWDNPDDAEYDQVIASEVP